MHTFKRGDLWWVKFYIAGREIRRSLKTSNEAEAKRKALALYRSIEIPDAPATRTLFAVMADWVDAAPRGRTELSMAKRIKETIADQPIGKLNNQTLAKVLSEVSNATYNRYVNCIMAAARLSHRNHKTPLPALTKRSVKETRLRALSLAEWARLKAQVPQYMLPMVEFSLATGLRKSNVLRLTWPQINFPARTVLVYADEAKARKRIVLPLNDWAMRVLTDQRDKDELWVFPGIVDGPVVDPKKAWNSALKRAEIYNFRWHDLRHTWARWAAESGMSLLELKELGGWADISMVTRYAHLQPSSLQSAANRLTEPAH